MCVGGGHRLCMCSNTKRIAKQVRVGQTFKDDMIKGSQGGGKGFSLNILHKSLVIVWSEVTRQKYSNVAKGLFWKQEPHIVKR